MTSGGFDVRNICPSLQYSCELICPLDTEERERDLEKPCYCDELCLELGDCCYDYFSRLVNSLFFSYHAQERGPLNLVGKQVSVDLTCL